MRIIDDGTGKLFQPIQLIPNEANDEITRKY